MTREVTIQLLQPPWTSSLEEDRSPVEIIEVAAAVKETASAEILVSVEFHYRNLHKKRVS